jgi:hypothetical protein
MPQDKLPASLDEATFDINKVVAELTVAAAKESVKNAGTLFSTTVDALSDLFTRIYGDYLQQTYRRVQTFKSFINPHQPIDLYKNFVPLNLRCGNTEIDHLHLIDLVKPGARIVISALAGRGKSILMKYIALTKYHIPDGTIPLFLELRALNSITKKDILFYLHNTYKGNKRLSYDKFLDYARAGSFVLVLDGFDEVNIDDRDLIEQQILEISTNFPKLSIIISGRPDEKFASWSIFNTYSILPMTIAQVEQLINTIYCDSKLKIKFLKQVKSKLYHSHESFLSTPLLATLMLLTFEQYADIPDKLHIFYDNAFETLFRKHDALKEQYVRTTRSNLPVDVFRKVFSAFCAISYSKSSYAFAKGDLIKDIGKALNYYQRPCKPEQFLHDLVESVCLMHIEGFEYHFVHRSFQEYFCALFLATSDTGTRNKFLDESVVRYGDNVVTMLFDMAQETVEKEWVVDKIQFCIDEIQNKGGKPIHEFLAEVCGIGIFYNNGHYSIRYWQLGNLYGILATLRRFYASFAIGRASEPIFTRVGLDQLNEKLGRCIQDRINARDQRFSIFKQAQLKKKGSGRDLEAAVKLNEEDEAFLVQLGLVDEQQSLLNFLTEIKVHLAKRMKTRMTFLDNLF